MARDIHKTAIVDPQARIADGVSIGAYTTVGPDVELGEGVILHNHVALAGKTKIGAETEIYPFTALGLRAQYLNATTEGFRLEIGARNQIREHVTMHPGTEAGTGLTKLGNDNMVMVGAHIAHDCDIGSHCIIGFSAALAGHVEIQDYVILGGTTGIHQFTRIGQHAFCGGGSLVTEDVIPYGLVTGNRAILNNLNLTGLKRRGFASAEIRALRSAFDDIFRQSHNDTPLAERVAKAAIDYADSACVAQIVAFMQAEKSRGYCQPKR